MNSHTRQLTATPKMQQRKERRMFSTSDDSAMTKQVQATHAPDGREIDVKPILQIVDEILVRFIARTVEGHEVRVTFYGGTMFTFCHFACM